MCLGRSGIGGYRPLGVGPRFRLAVLHQRDDRAQAVSAGVVRTQRQRPVERPAGVRHLPAQQMASRGLGPVAGVARVGAGDPLPLRPAGGQIGVVERPLHGVERIQQHGLARGFAQLGGRLFVGRHPHAALRVVELDQPVQHRQPRRVAGADREVELGAANGGGRGHGLHFQSFVVAANPRLAADQAQDALRDAGRGGGQPFARSDLLEFQSAVGVELELRAVDQLQGEPAVRAGPDRVAGRQRRADFGRSPAPFPQHLHGAQNADDFADDSLRQRGAERDQQREQQEIDPDPARESRHADPPEWPHRHFRSGHSLGMLPHVSCPC